MIAEGDVKLRHLARDTRCVLVVFEAVPPFRGVEVRGTGEFAAERRSKPGVLLRLAASEPRVWDLSAILPT